MPTMKLQFSKLPRQYFGGTRYTVGKWYYLDSHECCLWIKRGVVDMKTIEPAHLTEAAAAENDKNTGEGHALTLSEVLHALHEHANA